MRLKMILVALSVLFLMIGTAFAADVTGTWVAEREMPKMQGGPGGGGPGGGGPGGGGMGPQGPMKFTFDLKQDGSKLTGSVTMPFGGGQANEIQEGKIEGDKITFVIKMQGFQGNEMKIRYNGTVSGDEISFKTTFEGGGGRPGGGGPGGGGQRPERPPLIAKRQK